MWNFVNNIWLKVKDSKIFWALVASLILFIGGYLLGRHHKIPPPKVVEHQVVDSTTKQQLIESQKQVTSLQQQLTVAQTQITDLKSHVKTVVHIVHDKDGSTTVDKTTESDTDKIVNDTTNTSQTTNNTKIASDDKKQQVQTTTHTDTVITVTPTPKDKFYLGLSARLSLKGITDPGVEFKYRLLDLGRVSIWTGTEVIAPIPSFQWDNTQFRINSGVSF